MQPQERSGTYRFDGYAEIMTANLLRYISSDVLLDMYAEVRKYVELHDGADKGFTFLNSSTGRKVIFYDCHNEEETKKMRGLEKYLMNFYIIMLE